MTGSLTRGQRESTDGERYFAVIDTETNRFDEVMSIGVVIADTQSFLPTEQKYYVLSPEYMVGGMFSGVLDIPLPCAKITAARAETIADMRRLFGQFGVRSLFAYNANFDRGHLPEVDFADWYDIMKVAVYRQFNAKIPKDAPCCKTGRLKHGCGVQPIYRMLSGNGLYLEKHNALTDALDELEIMRMLGHPLEVFKHPEISSKKPSGKQTVKPPAKLPVISEGTRVTVREIGSGVITEVNDFIIKVRTEQKVIAFTRRDAFEQGRLKIESK